jgi:hypothetical protein
MFFAILIDTQNLVRYHLLMLSWFIDFSYMLFMICPRLSKNLVIQLASILCICKATNGSSWKNLKIALSG